MVYRYYSSIYTILRNSEIPGNDGMVGLHEREKNLHKSRRDDRETRRCNEIRSCARSPKDGLNRGGLNRKVVQHAGGFYRQRRRNSLAVIQSTSRVPTWDSQDVRIPTRPQRFSASHAVLHCMRLLKQAA